MTEQDSGASSDILAGDILSADNKPFATSAAAGAARHNRGYDSAVYKMVAVTGGYVLRPVAAAGSVAPTAAPEPLESEPTQANPGPQRCFWVRIDFVSDGARASAKYADVCANNIHVVIPRGMIVPLPESIVNAMRSTLHESSRHSVGMSGGAQHFVQDQPFTIIEKPCSWADWQKWSLDTDHGLNLVAAQAV